MKVTEVWPSRYLEAANLGGKEHTLTIARVVEKHRDVGTDGKPFVRTLIEFKDRQKAMLAGPEKCKIIRDRLGYGDDMQSWVGKPLTIYPSTRNAFGDPKLPCIKIRVKEADGGRMG